MAGRLAASAEALMAMVLPSVMETSAVVPVKGIISPSVSWPAAMVARPHDLVDVVVFDKRKNLGGVYG